MPHVAYDWSRRRFHMMELTNSLVEKRFRSSLGKLQYTLIDHPRHDDIVTEIATFAGANPKLFAVESSPDNGDDHFILLVNFDQIVELYASRLNNASIVIERKVPFNEFTSQLSMINQIMLAVALDMSRQI